MENSVNGLAMSDAVQQVTEQDYGLQWYEEYKKLEGTMSREDFDKAFKVLEFFVVEAGVDNYNYTLGLDRNQAYTAFDSYMVIRGLESEAEKVFYAVQNITPLT